MRRYWLPESSFQADRVLIQGEEFHHIHDVCRQGLGDKFEVLRGDGYAYFVEVTEARKKELTAQILERRELQALKRPFLKLVLCVPRFPVLENVLEKMVELGVHSIQLCTSDFSFMKEKRSVLKDKRERWEKIIKGAYQQSGRDQLLHFPEALPLEKVLEEFNQKRGIAGLWAYEGEGQMGLQPALQDLHVKNPQEIWFFVGAEGGFSHREIELFRNVQLSPVTLGSQVLRVETACVSLASIIKYQFKLME